MLNPLFKKAGNRLLFCLEKTMRYWLLLLTLIAPLSFASLEETDWLDLMPEEDRIALENMPEIEHQGAELNADFGAVGGLKQGQGLPEVMYSAKTVPEMDGRTIRLAGYPVPLNTDAKGRVIELFLVPYPGACIHVPPPPPNQIVLVRYPQGIAIEDIYEPIEVTGPLTIEPVSNDLADAAYAIGATKISVLDEAY